MNKTPHEICDIAIEAARTAGALALSHYKTDLKSWEKHDTTPVSEADLEVDALLHRQLLGATPDFGWLSEETADNDARLSKDWVWIVDPIDGTRAFLKGRPEWVISIGAVYQGKPMAGAIFNPVTDELFSAVKGRGAKLNGEPIQVSKRFELEGCYMLGHASMFARPEWPMPWPPMEIDLVNAIAYRMALVACGKFDATLSLSFKNEWDTAAGCLIVTEAGGVVSDHQGAPLSYNQADTRGRSLICAGPALHASIEDRVRLVPDVRISSNDA